MKMKGRGIDKEDRTIGCKGGIMHKLTQLLKDLLKRIYIIYRHLTLQTFLFLFFFFVKDLKMAEEHGEELEEPGSDMDSYLGR